MDNVTSEVKKIEEKLKFIGLDMENLTKFIINSEILLTPTNRLNNIQEKYSSASTIYSYFNPKDDEGILKHATLLKMIKDFNIEEVKQIEAEQKELNKNIPFKIKFKDNYLWQVYYSENEDKYFMLVTTKDLDYAGFFYLLKKKIEYEKTGKSQKIYVPISHAEHSGRYLKRSEFSDIEKYLWLFTKDWPLTYEIYDTNEKMSVYISGETNVFEKIKSYYRIKLNSKEEAVEFYKLIKALFILQTELPHYYNFTTKIGRYGDLEFEYQNKKISYGQLADLIKKEVNKNRSQISKYSKEVENLNITLKQLQKKSAEQEEEYIQKEKQIALYLECRKTFFGKVKYFIQTRKGKKIKNNKQEIKLEEKEPIQEESVKQTEFADKEYYTIEDLVKICKELDKIESTMKKLKLDIKACENKIESMEMKIKNATLYIEEIDSHEKSIFEFWKFANKDEKLMLTKATEEDSKGSVNKISKSFDYEEDMEDFGAQIDKTQRNIFNKSETDAIFVMDSDQREIMNNWKEEQFKEGLERLKIKAEQERILFQKENFDIFGGISEDSTKIKLIGSKKHREVSKDIIQILDITKNTDETEYKQSLEKQINNFKGAMSKTSAPLCMNLYIQNEEKYLPEGIQKAHINPKVAINESDSEKIFLHKINIKPGDNIIYLSNIIFYENNNRTLPLGMDLSDAALINLEEKEFNKKSEKNYRIVEEVNENAVKIRQFTVIEYEERTKEENDK